MRAVVQRVSRALVEVEGRVVAEIGPGLVALVGVAATDGPAEVEVLAAKLADLRVFPDHEGRMNRSLIEAQGAVLVVSQFTLYGDVRRGRRPSFTEAALPDHARPLLDRLVSGLRDREVRVETGEFGAHMQVSLTNDGPVTLILEVVDGRIS